MKLNAILHPEIVLNLRGEKDQRGIIKAGHDVLGPFRDDINTYAPHDFEAHILKMNKDPRKRMLMSMMSNDKAFLDYMVSTKRFKDKVGTCYYIPKDFLLVLSKLDKDIPYDILPDNFCAYFQFPKGVLADDTSNVIGGYVNIEPWVKNLMAGERLERFLSLTYVCEDLSSASINFALPKERCTFEEVADGCSNTSNDLMIEAITGQKSGESKEHRYPIHSALLNATIYTISQDPEILALKPFMRMRKRESEKAKKQFKGERPVNMCTLPVSVLNWDYHEGRVYSKEETWVKSHPVWQRCGKGLSDVRLIWRKGHTRKFTNVKEEPFKEVPDARNDNYPSESVPNQL